MNRIEHQLCRLIKKKEPVVLATILSKNGSTPRVAGTKMIIRENGDILGTIGGGIVEAQVMKMAPELLKTGNARICTFDLSTAGIADGMDMICGGKERILMEKVSPDRATCQMYETFLHHIRTGQKSLLAADITDVEKKGGTVERCLILEDGNILGSRHFSSPAMETLLIQAARERSPSLFTVEGRLFLAEPASSAGTVYLFGAGHVSQQTALLTKMMDFRTIVIDDRAEYANPQRFETSDQVIVIEDFDHALDNLDITPDSYIVILTRGHVHDQSVLAQALKSPARYIGMIGSRQKRNTIYQNLVIEGFTEEKLRCVHAPIGMAINAETPAEIAVSIVAELIAVRADTKI